MEWNAESPSLYYRNGEALNSTLDTGAVLRIELLLLLTFETPFSRLASSLQASPSMASYPKAATFSDPSSAPTRHKAAYRSSRGLSLLYCGSPHKQDSSTVLYQYCVQRVRD